MLTIVGLFGLTSTMLILVLNLYRLQQDVESLEQDIEDMKHNHNELQNHICYNKRILNEKSQSK